MDFGVAAKNDTGTPSYSDEWVEILCNVIRKELASVDETYLCSADKEDELYLRFVSPKSSQSQISRAKFEIRSAVSTRRRELVMRDVTRIMRDQPNLDSLFVGPRLMSDYLMLGRVRPILAEIDSSAARLEVLVPWIDHADERGELQRKIDRLTTELYEIGFEATPRMELVSILTEFLCDFHAIGRDWFPVLEEHELLEPIAKYISQERLRNAFTTKFFLVSMLELIGRPSAELINKCEKRSLFGPISSLIIAVLLFSGCAEARVSGIISDGLWLACVAFFGWSSLRCFNYLRAKWIHARLKTLVKNFNWLNKPITCDGGELVAELRKIDQLGLSVPSLLYSLMRLLVPGAYGLN